MMAIPWTTPPARTRLDRHARKARAKPFRDTFSTRKPADPCPNPEVPALASSGPRTTKPPLTTGVPRSPLPDSNRRPLPYHALPRREREGVPGSLRVSNVPLEGVGEGHGGCPDAPARGTADVPVSFPSARSSSQRGARRRNAWAARTPGGGLSPRGAYEVRTAGGQSSRMESDSGGHVCRAASFVRSGGRATAPLGELRV